MAESIQKEDWERFRALGKVPKSIRELVLQSWRRSETKPEIPSLKRAPRVSLQELARLRQRSSVLRKSASPVMGRTGALLRDSGAIVLMCDPEGIVLDADGDQEVLERASENHLYLGGRWDEGAIGTNAIGTALHLKRPVQISGVEHFCEEIQRWSCAASPVVHPANDKLLGVVDITGPVGTNQKHAALMSAALASEIGMHLRDAGEVERQKLIDRLLSVRRYWSNDEVLLIDRFGENVYSTEMFRDRARELGDMDAVRDRFRRMLDEPPARIANGLTEAMPTAEIEVVEDGGEPIGAMIVLPSRRRRRRLPDDPELDLGWIAAGGEEMARLCASAARLADSHLPVLIEGETGVGKEVLARAMAAEARPGRPFDLIYCGELSVERLRLELEGEGRISQLLHVGGVLCLDEPADAPGEVQSLLFQLLKTEIGARPDGLTARVFSLSSGELSRAMEEGRLRPDLYFKLNGARLVVPPLRDRPDDVRRLAQVFRRALPAALWQGGAALHSAGDTKAPGLSLAGQRPAAAQHGRTACRAVAQRDRRRNRPARRDPFRARARVRRLAAQHRETAHSRCAFGGERQPGRHGAFPRDRALDAVPQAGCLRHRTPGARRALSFLP